MSRWDGSVCRLKRVGLHVYDEKVSQSARLPNVLLLFVLLVPKTTRENGENLRRLTRLPQTQDQVPSLRQCC